MGKLFTGIFSAVAGGVAGAAVAGRAISKSAVRDAQLARKHLAIMQVMNQWIVDRQNGKELKEFFLRNGYKEIAVYGMSYLGERLVDELDGSEVKIKYAVDKNANSIYAPFDVLEPEDDLPAVDVIVVTAFFFLDEIKEVLAGKVDCPIVSIEDVVYEVS